MIFFREQLSFSIENFDFYCNFTTYSSLNSPDFIFITHFKYNDRTTIE